MRLLVLPLLLISISFGFEMTVKSGKEDGQKYSLLRLFEEDRMIACRENTGEYMQVESVTCRVDRSFAGDIKNLSHPYFSLTLQKDKTSFVLTVTSPVALKLFDKSRPFYQQKSIDYFETTKAHSWLIVAYSGSLPYIRPAKKTQMGFPIPNDFESMPSVGAVDVNSKPMEERTGKDVHSFTDLEKEFAQGNYDYVLQSADKLLSEYEDSIFVSDFLRYKIKAMFQKSPADNFDAIVKDSKRFLRSYSSDEYLPEILLILAKTYAKSGFGSDAKYFFKRLINEHGGSFYAAMGKVEYALFVQANEKNNNGSELLEEVFYNTSHIAAASYAADELFAIHIQNGDINQALEYVRMVWENNRQYYLKQQKRLHTVAKKLAEHKEGLDQAVKMNRALLKKLDRNKDAAYEDVAYEIAKWLDKARRYEEAYGAYEDYLEKFQYGQYAQKAKERLDILLSKQDDIKLEDKLERLDELIANRMDESIGKSALIAKMQILQENERYKPLLALKDKAADLEGSQQSQAQQMLKDAFEQLAGRYLRQNECSAFATLYQNNDYQVDTQKYDNEALYRCYMEAADYARAQEVAQSNTGTGDIGQKALWLCRLARAVYEQNDYAQSNAIYEDVIATGRQARCSDLYSKRFDIAHRLGMQEQMISSLSALEERRGQSVELLPLQKKLIEYLSSEDLKRVYIQRMLTLQQQLDTHTFTPWIQLQAAQYLQADNELVSVLQEALQHTESSENKARVHFELGNLFTNMQQPNQAVQSYESCMEYESMWKSICGDSLELVQN